MMVELTKTPFFLITSSDGSMDTGSCTGSMKADLYTAVY